MYQVSVRHVELEDLPHILLPRCHLLRERANYLTTYLSDTLSASPTASFIARNILNSEDDHLKIQFFLDPTVIPEIIAAAQSEPNILSLILSVTTTWCYSMNRESSAHICDMTKFKHYDRRFLV